MPESTIDPPQTEPIDPVNVAAPAEDAPGDADQYQGLDVQEPQDLRSDAQKSASWYPQTLLDVRYEFWSGNEAVAPAAADGTPGSAVKAHAGRWKKVARWSYERLNDWPVCPHPDNGNLYDPQSNPSGDVLEYASFVLANPSPGPGGVMVYRVSGTFIYGVLVPLNDWGPFGTGATPEKTLTGQQNRMQPVQFDRSMLQGF